MAVVGVVGRIGVPLAVLCVATSACGLLDESAALSGTVPRPTGPPEAAAAEFLAAWSAGDDARAAQLTTDATTAATTIADVRRRLGVTAVQAVPEATPGATKVPFAATVALGEAGTWIYRSTVQVVASRGRWAVRWSPAVIHPKLRNGSHLTIGPVPCRRPPYRPRSSTATVRS